MSKNLQDLQNMPKNPAPAEAVSAPAVPAGSVATVGDGTVNPPVRSGQPSLQSESVTNQMKPDDERQADVPVEEEEGTVAFLHPKRVEVTDDLRAARDDSKTRLAVEISEARSREKKAEEALNPDESGIKVRLLKPHTHSGISYPGGRTIFVDEVAAKFIEQEKIGERA